VHPERLPCLDDARWYITGTDLADMNEYDRDFWEERWSQALREHGGRVAQRSPNAHLTAEVGHLRPGRALDAGCGHGSDTLWLAARGWQVTAVDFAATALAYARSTAEAMGPDVAERIEWVEADLATWTPERDGRPRGQPVRARGRVGRGDGAATGGSDDDRSATSLER